MRPALWSLSTYLLLTACSGDTGVEIRDSGAVDSSTEDAQELPDADLRCAPQEFVDIEIPMRDGLTLAATVRKPADTSCRVPAILIQTPYDKDAARTLWLSDGGENPLFDSTDYAFVVVDWRGFYGSTNAAVDKPNRGEDGFDTVEWIAEQPWSDGGVGMWGVSALCRAQYWTAIERPPHLVAAVPIFCALNDTYEQYYPGGVLRREWIDTLGVLFGGSIVKQHPLFDAVWNISEGLYSTADIAIPMLVVAGWYDLDPGANLDTFRSLVAGSSATSRDEHRLLVGPWIHQAVGGESSGGRALDEIELAYVDADNQIQGDSLRWFDLKLRGISNESASWSRVRAIVGGEDLPTEGSDTWPPVATETLTLYLGAEGSLLETIPQAGTDEIVANPEDPSPSIGGNTLRFDLFHGPRDQAEVIARADASTFQTAVLTEPLQLRGPIAVTLAVSTTGDDTDFAIRITDIDEAGQHTLLGEGIHRLKLRSSFATPAAVVPGQRYSLQIKLRTELGYSVPEGHRIGLIVTPSNFPRFAVNPNNGDNFYSTPANSVTATNTLYLDGEAQLQLTVAQ